MIVTNDNPNIQKYFKDENISWQEVYRAKENYDVVYINPKLYEEIFNEKYEWLTASKNISEQFSITLDKEKSDSKSIGKGFSDRQSDPTGLALSGNQGSGRAYFFGEIFNIKGDKTTLATSPNSMYNNGKYALSAAIKETVISNILAEDFIIPAFQTLAILLTKEKFDFIDEYLDENDEIQQKTFNLPSVIEIRVNKEKELYRISNSLINKDNYSKNDIEKLCKRLAIIEANKFADRFLHGSWSVGNISTEGNLIDFDTACFVKGRFPQFSNTPRFKSNYFGNELSGQKLMINAILKELNMLRYKEELEALMDKTYNENLKIRFCDLIGLDYKIHYKEYQEYIDSLFETFNNLSRKFLPNYYATNVYSKDSDITYVFDFSRFFQKYLIEQKNPLLNLKYLLNESEELKYENLGMIKNSVEEFFSQDLMTLNQIDDLFNDVLDFVMEYNKLFKEIEKENNINNIIYKQYIKNADRNYVYANQNIYGKLSWLYETKKIDLKTLNIIINALIKTNKRNSTDKENIIGLELYQKCLTYFVVTNNYYKFVVESYSEIDNIKVVINKKEMVMHSEKDNVFNSDKVDFEIFPDILAYETIIKVDGEVDFLSRLC